MRELIRGANAPLAGGGTLGVSLTWSATPAPLDIACFLLGADGRVLSDEHMVFYNQPRDPAAAVTLIVSDAARAAFQIDLERLPPQALRCVFTATLDGAGTFGAVRDLALTARPAGAEAASYRVSDAAQERALILGEVYRHASGWKLRAVGQGFNGGLGPLAESFGVVITEEPVPAPVAPNKIDLLKRQVMVTLDTQRLRGERARVAAVIDASGSMSKLFKDGTIQRTFERVLAVAACMADDGALDVWFFATTPLRGPSATEQNFEGYVARVHPKPGGAIGATNNEPAVMRDVIQKYTREDVAPGLPAYVIFFSDGGVSSGRDIAKLLTDAARHPIFWQFVGIGRGNYGILERLDTLPGRLVDNANFFALDDLDRVSEAELFARLLHEYPDWLQAARGAGVL